MAISPERKVGLPIEERTEEFEVSPELEQAGIRGVEEAVKARVKERGRHLIQTPAVRKVTIQLPTDKATLVSWARGPITNSLTWFATFWLRMIKKATHFGWRVMGRKGE